MDNTCANCQSLFNYNPFVCDQCGVFLCLTCFDKTEICNDCIDIQKVSLELAKPQPKCVYCNQDALFIEDCDALLGKKACIEKIQVCKDHIVKCESCNKMICKSCGKNGRCRKHMKQCISCRSYVLPSNIQQCIKCGKHKCKTCAWGNAGVIIYSQNGMLCETHIKKCTCGAAIYDAPLYRCTYPGCVHIACQNGGMFTSLIGKSIYACHSHRSTCLVCCKQYPLINNKTISFRGDTNWECCSNCAGSFRDGVIGLLQVCMRMFPLPTDIKNIIFRMHLSNIATAALHSSI